MKLRGELETARDDESDALSELPFLVAACVTPPRATARTGEPSAATLSARAFNSVNMVGSPKNCLIYHLMSSRDFDFETAI